MPDEPRWPIWQVDQLINATLKNDATIKTLQGITDGDTRVSGYKVVLDPDYFPYIFFYSIPGPNARGQGTSIVQFNPDYDIEVRTIGAPDDNSEATIDRIDTLIGKMVRQLTPNGLWVVSAVSKATISIVEQGESPEVYYTRRGNSYKFQVVRA